MSKGIYIGIDGKARKVKKLYVGVDGKARKVKKGYVGVNGVARLFYSGGGSGLLPSGYTELEYAITQANSQYNIFIRLTTSESYFLSKVKAITEIKFDIMPGYTASLNTLEIANLLTSVSDDNSAIGVSVRKALPNSTSSQLYYAGGYNNSDGVSRTSITANTHHVIVTLDMQSLHLKIEDLDNDSYTEQQDVPSVSSSATVTVNGMSLFGASNYTTGINTHFKLRVYSFELYNDGALIAKLIPCKNSIGKVGFYDTVGKQFLTPSNSGVGLTAGPEA